MRFGSGVSTSRLRAQIQLCRPVVPVETGVENNSLCGRARNTTGTATQLAMALAQNVSHVRVKVVTPLLCQRHR